MFINWKYKLIIFFHEIFPKKKKKKKIKKEKIL